MRTPPLWGGWEGLLCPFTDGPAVYLARSLYNAANATNLEFVNNCPEYHPPVRINKTTNDAQQLKNAVSFDIAVYPNPNNDGIIYLSPYEFADLLLNITVTDLSGKEVYKGNVQTQNGNGSLQLDVNNGVYQIKVTNILNNESITKKLVITK